MTDEFEAAAQQFPFVSPEVKTTPGAVRFVTSGDEKEFTVPPPTIPTIKVRVLEPFRVVHEATAYTHGEEFDAPADDTTNLWLRSGYIELVTPKRKK